MRALQIVVMIVCMLVGAGIAAFSLQLGKDSRFDPNWLGLTYAAIFFGFALFTAYAMRGTRKY